MKKILSLLFISLIILPVFAITTNEPQWVEFCPSRYATIDTQSDYIAPEKKYWQQRRMVFNNRIQECNANTTQSEVKACYSEVRKIEKDATKIYIDNKRAEQSRIRMYMKL